MTYRKGIIISYLVLLLTVISSSLRNEISGPIIATLGIATTFIFLFSPVTVWYAIKDYYSEKTITNSLYLVLAVIFLIFCFVLVYKLWPQLMGI